MGRHVEFDLPGASAIVKEALQNMRNEIGHDYAMATRAMFVEALIKTARHKKIDRRPMTGYFVPNELYLSRRLAEHLFGAHDFFTCVSTEDDEIVMVWVEEGMAVAFQLAIRHIVDILYV